MPISKKIFIALVFISQILSCDYKYSHSGKQSSETIIKEYSGKKFILPDSLITLVNGVESRMASKQFVMPQKPSMVSFIWGDCHACTEKLLKWEALLSNGKLSGANIVLIVATSNKAYFQKVLYPDLNSRQALVIDEYHAISAMNSIPQGEQEYSTFLLDTSRHIQVVGDPLVFPKLMDLYEQIISKTNNHDN